MKRKIVSRAPVDPRDDPNRKLETKLNKCNSEFQVVFIFSDGLLMKMNKKMNAGGIACANCIVEKGGGGGGQGAGKWGETKLQPQSRIKAIQANISSVE